MDDPVVTILMPCKNPHWGFYDDAIASVIGQTCPRWALLVITTVEEEPEMQRRTSELCSGDPRVRVIAQERDSLTAAFNTGMKAAGTEFVAILLGDDELASETVEVLDRNIREHTDVDFFHSSRRYIDEKGDPIGAIFESRKDFSLEEFKKRGVIKHLLCWRLSRALEIGGMDESLGPHGADDYDFPWCMAEAGCRFRAIPECLYLYRDHHEHFRLTTHVPLSVQVQELRKIFRKHGMSPVEIDEELQRRSADYLSQALFTDEEDMKRKVGIRFDASQGKRS
jgi:glycosyltransferase involved in cell wall biosynthesis